MKFDKKFMNKVIACAKAHADITSNSWVVNVSSEDGVGRVHLLKDDFIDCFGTDYETLRLFDKGCYYVANTVEGVEFFCLCILSELKDFAVSDEEIERLLKEEEEEE